MDPALSELRQAVQSGAHAACWRDWDVRAFLGFLGGQDFLSPTTVQKYLDTAPSDLRSGAWKKNEADLTEVPVESGCALRDIIAEPESLASRCDGGLVPYPGTHSFGDLVEAGEVGGCLPADRPRVRTSRWRLPLKGGDQFVNSRVWRLKALHQARDARRQPQEAAAS